MATSRTALRTTCTFGRYDLTVWLTSITSLTMGPDEWIDGKFLPKGTTLFLNVWGLHHDEAKFGADHDVFDPDHFKGQTLLAAELANSADPEQRDHFGYGMFCIASLS